MGEHERELVVSELLAGRWRLECPSGEFFLTPLSPAGQLRARMVYQEVYQQARLEGLSTQAEHLGFLYRHQILPTDWEDQARAYRQDIENCKIGAYHAVFRSAERKRLKTHLGTAQGLLGEILAQRHALDHWTAEGVASIAQARCQTALALRDLRGKRVWPGDSYLEDRSLLLDEVMEQEAARRLGEAELRLLARTEPWRSWWSCRRLGRLGRGQPSESLRQLVIWSNIYDSVQKHPDCPPDAVLEDDDLLDGWFLVHRRKREEERRQKEGEQAVGNEKIAGMGEVYVMADTPEDARRIEDLNSPQAKFTKAERMAYLKKHGHVKEWDMPDTKRANMARLHEMTLAQAHQGKS